MTASFKVLILIVIGFIYGVLFFHSYFHINEIDYEGENFVSRMSLDYFFESYYDRSVVRWGYMGALKKHLLHEFPQLGSVDVSITFPDKIHFNLIEKPDSISFFTEENTIFMAEDGTVMNADDSANAHIENLDSIMIIKGVPTRFLSGDTIDVIVKRKIDKLVFLLMSYLPELTLQVECKVMDVLESDLYIQEITLLKDDHIPIFVGKMDNLEQKLLNLKHFYHYTYSSKKTIGYVDLRVSDRVIVNYEN